MSGASIEAAAKHLIIGVLALLILSPCIALVWKGTRVRRSLWRVGCWRWVICCDRLCGESVSADDFVERSNGGAQTVAGHYQQLFADRAPRSTLRLATWRESVRVHAPAGQPARLQEIKINAERAEPLVLPERRLPGSMDKQHANTSIPLAGTSNETDSHGSSIV